MSEWEYKKLQNLCDVRDGTHDSPKYYETGVPFITSKNLTANGIDFNNVSYISVENHKSFSIRSKVERGDILFGMIGTIGKPVIVNVDFEFSIKNVALLKFGHSNKELINEFAIQVLNSNIIEEQFRNKSDGGVQSFISLSAIRNLYIPVPPIPQQQKIALILSTVDAVIEKTEVAIAKYKAIKAGMMHDLFTRGIADNGQLRPSYQQAPHLYKPSKLGWIPKEWEIETMDNISLLMTNGFVGVATPFYATNGDGVIYLYGNNIRQNKIDLRTTEKIKIGFHNKLKKSQLKPDDMLTVQSGHIGTSAVVPYGFPAANCHALIITRFKSELVIPRYISYYINSEIGMSRMESIFVGSTIKHVNVKEFKAHLIPLAPKEEQANINSRIDSALKKIELEQTTLNKHQKLKQGLMQDLLTGKITVSV